MNKGIILETVQPSIDEFLQNKSSISGRISLADIEALVGDILNRLKTRGLIKVDEVPAVHQTVYFKVRGAMEEQGYFPNCLHFPPYGWIVWFERDVED